MFPIGTLCYIEKGKQISGDNIFYLEGIGSVYVDPACPTGYTDNKFLGRVQDKPDSKCESYWYCGVYFVFPLLPITNIHEQRQRKIEESKIKFNMIEVNPTSAIIYSRQLLEKYRIENSICELDGATYIVIEDLSKLDEGIYLLEKLILNDGGRHNNTFLDKFTKRVFKSRKKKSKHLGSASEQTASNLSRKLSRNKQGSVTSNYEGDFEL